MIEYARSLLKLAAPEELECIEKLEHIREVIRTNEDRLPQGAQDGINQGLRARGIDTQVTVYSSGKPPPGAINHYDGTMRRYEFCIGDYEAMLMHGQAVMRTPKRFFIDRWDPPGGKPAWYTLWEDPMCMSMVGLGPNGRATTDFWEAVTTAIKKTLVDTILVEWDHTYQLKHVGRPPPKVRRHGHCP